MAVKGRARMRDVAELAGVGTMTVSRVLSGSVPVSEGTRARVLAAIEKLNYQPNEIARSLREARTRTIGIIVPNFYDSFFARCAHAVSQIAQERGYSVIVTTSAEDAAVEYREASLLVRRNIDGLVVIPAWFGVSQFHLPEFSALPLVTLDRLLPGQDLSPRFRGSVMVDNAHGARLAVEHLIEHGHSKILYLGLSNNLSTLQSRYRGYEDAMLAAGLKPESFFTCATQESTADTLRNLVAGGSMPSAIFSSNNLVTQYVLHGLAALKLEIPKDVALIGFDDLEMFDIFMPPITVIRQPLEALGRTTGEMLLERLKVTGAEASADVDMANVILPVELVLRRSCGCMS